MLSVLAYTLKYVCANKSKCEMKGRPGSSPVAPSLSLSPPFQSIHCPLKYRRKNPKRIFFKKTKGNEV